jgi:Tfp pilus assembly protein PilX
MRTIPALQRGAALTITLILLIVFSLLGVFVLSNTMLELRMTGNMQETVNSFESAEAGAAAVLLRPEAFDVTAATGAVNQQPLGDGKAATLSQLRGGADSVTLRTVKTDKDVACPRQQVASASSMDLINCDYYRVEADHELDSARTRIEQGVAQEHLFFSSQSN